MEKPNNNEVGDIRFEDRYGYLYAFVTGEKDSLSVSLKYWQRVIDESVKRGYKRLLVEEEFHNQVSMIDMYGGVS